MKMQYKSFDFTVKEANDENSTGIVGGFASTFGNVDLEGDIIAPGAFTKSLDDFRSKGKKIPLLFSHDLNEPIGGFSPDRMQQTEKGLSVIGEIDLDTQRGREVYSLTKKGYLSAFSIGFSIMSKDDIEMKKMNERIIKNVKLHEISITAVPANPKADISFVKGAVSYKDLPLAPDDTEWDKSSAIADIKSHTGSTDAPSSTYKNYFMWYDASSPDNFGSYKLPYAKNVGGTMKAVPNALSAIVGAINGARGGLDIPDSDKASVKTNVSKYYKKMNKDDPFNASKDLQSLIQCAKYWNYYLKIKTFEG